MGKKETKMSAMEIDDPKFENAEQILPKFSINVLQLMKSSQAQHGLRHDDYAQYRRYCSSRLRRLYKSLKFTHGCGKYTRRAILESIVTDVRFLHVVFYMAERAWSHAMEKRQLPDGPNAKQRIYLIGRLRKAVKWASLFSSLCSIKTDSRTSLEAEAYESSMKGTLLFEQEKNWETGLACFKNARAVYEELGKYGDVENQVLCRERVAELVPSIEYCLHKIGKSNLQISELLRTGEMEGPALDLFKTKIEAGIEEARSQQAASLTEFNWLGYTFPVSNPKSRVSIFKAQELEKELQGPTAESLPADKKLSIFDELFTAYYDARNTIRSDLVSAGNAEESVKDNLNGLNKAVEAVLRQRTIERNQLLVKIAKSKLNKKRDDKSEKVTRPEELVRLYDLLLQNVADISDLISSGRNRKPEEIAFDEECQRKSLAFRAERCFYVAKSYSLAGKRVEAFALYGRARSLAEDALNKFQSIAKKDEVCEGKIQELKTLIKECRANSCIEHAMGIMKEEKASQNMSKKISTISLNDTTNKVEGYLLDKLDVYESAVEDSNTKTASEIERFPPGFQSIPRNPIDLDLAKNCINFPVIENRMKKDRKGFISCFWFLFLFLTLICTLKLCSLAL